MYQEFKKDVKESGMGTTDTWCGRCLIVFFTIILSFFIYVLFALDFPVPLDGRDVEPPLILETDRIPMISPDKKIIYVASEEGLPVAHNFILRNPSIPIEKIVYRKPGQNSTLHVYPIQREGLWATNDSLLVKTDTIALCAFIVMLIVIIIIMYVFTCQDLFSRDASPMSIDGFDLYFDSPLGSPHPSPVKPPPKGKGRNSKNPKELEPLIIV